MTPFYSCLCLRTCHPQQTLSHHSPPSFSYSDWPDSWLFIQRDQPAAHQGPIGGPWRPPISQPLHEVPNNQPKLPTCCSEPQEPVSEGHQVRPARSGPSRESPRDRRHHILGDVYQSDLRGEVRVRVQTRRGWCPGLRLFGAEHLHHPVPHLRVPVPGL